MDQERNESKENLVLHFKNPVDLERSRSLEPGARSRAILAGAERSPEQAKFLAAPGSRPQIKFENFGENPQPYDFADVIEGNLLAEWPGDVAVPPKMSGNAPELSTNLSSFIKHNVRRLKRFTAYFPLTLSATFLHSLRPHIDNLLLNMVKRVMSPSDVNEAKRIIYEIHQLEKKGELAHIFPSTAKSKSVKRDSQYKDVWDEIFVFVKAHQRSKGHREVLEALRMMRGSDGPDGSSDTNAERTSKRRLHDGATKHGKQIFTFTSDGKTLLEEWNARIIAEDHSRTREMPGKSRPGVAGERLYPAFNTNKEETEA
ncbi:unnamed protein product [Notodromas monacha]|uniref:Protein asunder n=1 Tax=Notodromas monacha TaxID=399045 RepID=A0A7R9GCV3_9CRUS|nr:unnamed protein product [Notodromas monacha]CAG0916247.1 unnamed protein product [Notodromas monacha]